MTSVMIARRASARDTAERLIAATRAQSTEFPHTLANHLPMVLTILVRLGATPARLADYAEHYNAARRVPPLGPAGPPIDSADWRRDLGRRDREAAFRAFFVGEVARLGREAAIRFYVPTLAPGVAASALHALMRLAYGLIGDDDDEVGTALGYWATTFLPLPPPDHVDGDIDDPLAILLLMRDRSGFADIEPASPLLWHWIKAAGARPDLSRLSGRLALGRNGLARIAEAALALYASTMSFEALHALTGAHWLRQVAPLLDDPAPLLRSFWQAVMALYLKVGTPLPAPRDTLDAWRGLPVPPDEAIAARAVASDDEHDLSLVFSARQEFARTGDPLYQVVAARRVGLMP